MTPHQPFLFYLQTTEKYMAYVKARQNESIESLLKRFKKSVDNSGVLSTLKRYEYYEKPSVKRKRKQAAARKRALKQAKKRERQLERKRGGPSWKWNKDRTKKIPLRSNYRGKPNPSFKKRPHNRGNNSGPNRNNNRSNTRHTNRNSQGEKK